MREIYVLYGGNSHQHRTFNEPKYRQYFQEIIYLPDFQHFSLENCDVLLIPSQLHQGLLTNSQSKIMDFIIRGGTVVSLGAQPKNWLSEHNWEFRPTNFWWWLDQQATSGLVVNQPDHDFFKYVTLEDSTWHYHGVFWPPKGVDIPIALEDGGAILYIDKVSTLGTLIMTTLDPEYHYGSYFMPATERFLNGFLPWLAEGNF